MNRRHEPVVQGDATTRRDLADQRIGPRFASVEERIEAAGSDFRAAIEHGMRADRDSFAEALRAQTRAFVFALLSIVVIMSALAFALVRFA